MARVRKKRRKKNSQKKLNIRRLVYKRVGSDLYSSLSNEIEKPATEETTGARLKWNDPFVISTFLENEGKTIFHGSLYELAKKIYFLTSSLAKCMDDFVEDKNKNDKKVDSAIAYSLPVEEKLMLLALYSRLFNETTKAFAEEEIDLYDYEFKPIKKILLLDLFNQLMHNRYFVIVRWYISDLFSDRESLDSETIFGRRVWIRELLNTINNTIYNQKIKNFCSCMKETFNEMRDEKDLMFLTQNLHWLSFFLREKLKKRDKMFGYFIDNLFGEEIIWRHMRPAKESDLANIDLQEINFEKREKKDVQLVQLTFLNDLSIGIAEDVRKKMIQCTMTLTQKQSKDIEHAQFFDTVREFYGEEQLYDCKR